MNRNTEEWRILTSIRQALWLIVLLLLVSLFVGCSARPTCADTQDQIDVYRMCMRSASVSGCRLSFDEIVDYHQLKKQLEDCDNDGSYNESAA